MCGKELHSRRRHGSWTVDHVLLAGSEHHNHRKAIRCMARCLGKHGHLRGGHHFDAHCNRPNSDRVAALEASAANALVARHTNARSTPYSTSPSPTHLRSLKLAHVRAKISHLTSEQARAFRGGGIANPTAASHGKAAHVAALKLSTATKMRRRQTTAEGEITEAAQPESGSRALQNA